MKKHFIILISILTTAIVVKSQEEYRITRSTGQLKLNVTGVIIEGYDGKDIIFSGKKIKVEEVDERAKGLVPVSSSKYTDNTGLGISVVENGENVNVNLVAKEPIGLLTIKVPQNIKVSISNYNYNNYTMLTINNSNNNSEDVVLKNLKNEIEVSVYNNKVRLENNTGPMNIKTMSGAVEAIFSTDIKGPVSIISATNYVDITLPSSTKANIEMSTTSGKLYAGKEFKIDLDKTENDNRSIYNPFASDNLSGSINSGTGTVTLTTLKDGAVSTTTITNGVNAKNTKGTSNKTKSSGDVVTGPTITSINGNTNPVYVENKINGIAYSFGSAWTGGDKIKGKLNGGGIDLIFKSNNKNVYLRQQ